MFILLVDEAKPLENPLVFIFDLFFKLMDLTQKMTEFMFEEISVFGLGINVSVWQGLGGVGLTALIVYSLAK